MEKLLLSIVVPVYNQEKYLRECLDSLYNQDVSLDEYEVICVNDGSTDASLQILQEYAKKYTNLRIIDKPNGGVSSARNAGIEAVQGEYLWFIDSDDYIKDKFLAYLFDLIREYDPDSVFVLPMWDVEDMDYEKFRFKSVCAYPEFSCGPWKNIKRFSLVKHLRFNEDMKYGEDAYYEAEFYILPTNGVHIRIWDKVYYYRPNSEGACRQLDRTRKVEDSLKLVKFLKKLVDEQELTKEQEEILTIHKRRYTWSMMWFAPKSKVEYKDLMREIKSNGLKLPFLWALPETLKGFKHRLKKFVSRFFHIQPFYWIAFHIMRAKYNKQMKKQ